MGVDLTEETLDDFGDKEVILYSIEKELGTQFNTRKQLVLKTIYTYLDHSGSLYDVDCLSLFGTNSFNLVWEKVCAEIMDNQLDTRLGALKLPIPLRDKYNRQEKQQLIHCFRILFLSLWLHHYYTIFERALK